VVFSSSSPIFLLDGEILAADFSLILWFSLRRQAATACYHTSYYTINSGIFATCNN
jgi:hypothetical protein